MNVRLVMERKHKRVWATQLRGSETTVGRARGSTIRIPSTEVSRLHCRLSVENGIVTVEDLESVNGTFLNGVRVRDVVTVRPGDRLTVGPVTFLVEYELAPEALERLGGEGDLEVVEAADEIEIVGEASDEPMARPPKGPLPAAAPLDEEEDKETFVLEDEGAQMPMGEDLRDLLIELDESADRPKKRKK